MIKEHREFTRYKLISNKLYLCIHELCLTEKIHDISIGGLSFVYTPVLDEQLDIKLIDIFSDSENPFYLLKISCEKIYDHAALPEGSTFSGRNIRRCGLRYLKISKKHKICLENLFENKDIMAV